MAVKVCVVVITSSPGPMPSASSARCRPAVAEFTAMASSDGSPRNSANAVSKRFAFGPVVTQPDFSVSTTSAISSSPISGRANGRKGLDASFMGPDCRSSEGLHNSRRRPGRSGGAALHDLLKDSAGGADSRREPIHFGERNVAMRQ